MSLIVHKYGGSSVSSPEKIRRVARRVVEAVRSGDRVVVVVSAMGNTTSKLLDLANDLARDPSARELDLLLSSGERISSSLLALAIQELGGEAVALTGPQSGLITTDDHFAARISDVRPARVREELDRGRIPIIAGYQGETPGGEITTLGRGGSDTTAVAFAAALAAETCELNSDVPGVFSADPRHVDTAFPLPSLSCDEMLRLSELGAGVVNARALSYARDHGVEIVARSSFEDGSGTRILPRATGESAPVLGVASHQAVLWLRPRDDEKRFPEADLAERVQGPILRFGESDPSGPTEEPARHLLIPAEELPNPEQLEDELRRSFGAQLHATNGVSSISAVGSAFETEDRRRAAFDLVADAGLEAEARLESPGAITLLVQPEMASDAMQTLHHHLIDRPSLVEAAS